MGIYSQIKEQVSTREAAEHYGYKVSRNGMMCCPFHNDRTPSMKVDWNFICSASDEAASEAGNGSAFEDAGSKFMTEKYICQSMWNSFNVLIDRGQNAHREICECSALFFYLLSKTQNH